VLTTSFTRMFQVDHPIALAPMGGSAGGVLAAAVSNGGGLGLVGAGRSDREWLDRELALVGQHTDRPWGVGFQTWATTPELVDRALQARPAAVMLSFGDPNQHAARVHAGGSRLIVQVTDLDEARRAVDVDRLNPRDAGELPGRRRLQRLRATPRDHRVSQPLARGAGVLRVTGVRGHVHPSTRCGGSWVSTPW